MRKTIIWLVILVALMNCMMSTVSATTLYAPDGRKIEVNSTDVKKWVSVGWFEGETLYAPDGRNIKVSPFETQKWIDVGWYRAKTLYSLDGRTVSVPGYEVNNWVNVGWYTYPVYVADGSLSKPFLATNSNTINYLQNWYDDSHSQIIFNVTGYARGNDAEAIGGLENAEAGQEWILLKVKTKYLQGDGEMSFLPVEDYLYNKSGSKYNVYDDEDHFGYSWHKKGDIYNKGIYHYSTFVGGSMEGYVAVLTDEGAEMPIIKIPVKDGNMFVSTVGAPKLVKKTKEEIIAENPILSKCKLELPAVPTTLSNSKTAYTNGGYKDVLQSKFNVSEITYEFKETSGGKVDLHIYYKGEKTYDANGPGQTSDCKIGWKLYDREGYVLEDGTTYTMGIAMNEKFKDVEETIYSLEPGEYKLVIMGVNGY